MKQIILTEGRNDVTFISKYYEKYDFNLKKFLREDITGNLSAHRSSQDRCIRSFIEIKSPYDILVKSEGGKDSLVSLFCSEIISLVTRIEDVILMRDLDVDDFNSIEQIEKNFIEGIIHRHKCGNFKISPNKIIGKCSNLIAKKYNILKNDNNFGHFTFIAIKPSLENIAQINNHDDKITVDEKIDVLIKEKEISEFLDNVVLYRGINV